MKQPLETKLTFVALTMIFTCLTFEIPTMIIPATIMTLGVIGCFALEFSAERVLLNKAIETINQSNNQKFIDFDDRIKKCERASINRLVGKV